MNPCMTVTVTIAENVGAVTKCRIIEDNMGLFDLFKKKPEETKAVEAAAPPVEKIKKPRKPRVKKPVPEPVIEEKTIAAPEVKVLKMDFDPTNPRLGSMELDWNPEFVSMLKEHGYQGDKDEDVVDAWLTDVCKTISQNEFPMSENVRYIQRRDLGGGKTEFS